MAFAMQIIVGVQLLIQVVLLRRDANGNLGQVLDGVQKLIAGLGIL
jgi:hypothetical protein